MSKRLILSDYIENGEFKGETNKNKIFTPTTSEPVIQNKKIDINNYINKTNDKNKIFSPVGAVENTAPTPPSIANKTFYSNKGTPITFNSKADDKASKAGSVAAGLLDSSTLGIGSKILDKLQPSMTEQARSENPTAFNVGKFAGYIAPATAGTKLTKPLLKGITNPLLNRLAEGALVGAGMTGIEDKVNGKSWGDTGTDMAVNAGIGAGADLLLHGLGKTIPKIISKFSPKVEAPVNLIQEIQPKIKINNPKGMNFNQTLPKSEIQYETKINTVPKVSVYKAALPKNLNETMPLEIRDFKNVADKKVNAYQYDHPELKPYIQQEANILKGEVKNTLKGSRSAYYDNVTGENIVTGNKKITSQSIQEIQDITKANYNDIEKALDDIVADHGKENKALPKKIELIIDDRLSNGYNDFYTGTDLPKNENYLYEKSLIGKTHETIPMEKGYIKKPYVISKETIANERKPIGSLQNAQSIKSNIEPLGTKVNPIKELDYNKIDDPKVLENHIAELETAMTKADESTMLKMNLQLFAAKERLKKISKFYTNSLKETQMLPDEVKNMLNEADFSYGVKTNQGELNKAQQRLSIRGLDTEMNRLKQAENYNTAEDAMSHLLITRELRNEAQQTGDYSKVVDWLKDTRKKTTNTAQSLQALSAWKKTTPEGALIKATNVIDEVEKDLKQNNPKLIEKVNTDTKEVEKVIDEINTGAVDDIVKEVENFSADENGQFNFLDMVEPTGKETPPLVPELPKELTAADKLANKLDKYTAPKQTKMDLVENMGKEEKTMLNTLFNIAKEQLPKEKGKIQTSPMELISAALKNKNEYAEVWTKAKTILKDRFQFSDDRIAVLQDYLEKKLRPTFEENKLNKAISMQLKEKGINLSDIVKKHYSVNSGVREDLVNALTKEAGLSGEDADYLAKFIQNRMKELTKNKKEQVLKQMFKERKTPIKKTEIDKIIELSNLGGFENSKYRNLIAEKYGVPTLSSDDAKFITDTMTKVQTMEEGYKKDAEIAKVMQLIADKVPATASEKLQGYLRMSMLTNIKTLLTRNPLGNVGLGIAENIKDIPGALIDKGLSKVTGQRTTLAPSLKGLKEQGKGMVTGLKEWNMDRKLGVDTSPSKGQYELPNKRIFQNKVLNAVDQFTRRSLQLGDRPFYQGAYNERLRQLKVINKTDTVTENMIEDATNYALDRTLQNNKAGEDAKSIQKGLNKLGENKLGLGNEKFGIGNLALPFTTTPANILEKSLDYSPIGAFKASKEWMNFKKNGTFNQKKMVDELGRSITGTGAIILGWELAKNKLATGKSSTNERERELNKATGVTDYSFKVGDKYKTFDWFQPMALPLAIGIDMYNANKSKDDVFAALSSGGDTVFKQSYLQGISRMFGGYSPATAFTKTITDSYTQAMPTALKQVTQLTDPYQREVYSDNPATKKLNEFKAKTPFLSKTLPKKIDILGSDVKQFDGKNNFFNVMINPGFSNTDKNNKGTNMVRDVVESTGNKDILPKIIEPKITYISKIKNAGTKNREEVKETINLTPKELSELKTYIGQETNKMYTEKANNNSFMNKTSKDKAKELESLLRTIYDKGEEKILKDRNIKFY